MDSMKVGDAQKVADKKLIQATDLVEKMMKKFLSDNGRIRLR